MSVVAMESYSIKTVLIHLADESNFILSDHKRHCNLCSNSRLSLQSLRTVIFLALNLPSRKFQSVVNTNLAKKLAPNFAGWCAIPHSTSCIIFLPELLRVFEIVSTFENREEFTNWLKRFVIKKFISHYKCEN